MYPYENFQGPYNKMEIPRVSGRDGANSFQLAPNSSVLMIDLTQEDVIWCKSTDSAGFATLKPYRITEIEEPKVVDAKATDGRTPLNEEEQTMNPILRQLGTLQQESQNQNDNSLPTSLNDPRLDAAKNYVAQHGGNPQRAFYQLCNEKGLNPAGIINMVFGRK